MNSLTWLALFLMGSYALGADGDSLFLTGTCRNVTKNLAGHLRAMIRENNGALEGRISVTGWQGGSGALAGTRDGNKFLFKTRDYTGMVIEWQGVLNGSGLSGEFFVQANPKLRMERQGGEWEMKTQASLAKRQKFTISANEELLKLESEFQLNWPTVQKDYTIVTGAERLFPLVHPTGKGVSIHVEDVKIDWTAEAAGGPPPDIHKFHLTYVLYWQGVVQPTGWTRLRLSFNTVLDSVTDYVVLESTGATHSEVNQMAFDLGFMVGKKAVDSMLNSK